MTDEAAPLYAVIAGGGTAGHLLPGVAVANALVARGHDPASLLFVGSERGVERTVVPAAGFPLVLLPGRGIARRASLDNLGAVVGLLRAVWQALGLVRRRRPSVVVALGGYASVACVVAAVVWRVPLVVTEQNAVPGLANRLAARVARASAVPFAGVPLPRAVVTGNPVRAEIAALAGGDPAVRAGARAAMAVPEGRTLVAVFSGSLGARRVTEAVAGLVQRWCGRDLVVHHVTGTRDHEAVLAEVGALEGCTLDYRCVAYDEEITRLLAAADVAVCRAGGSTVAELAVAGLPAVLVPLPTAPGDHQRANADALAGPGGAVLLDDADCTTDRLAEVLGGLVDDPARLSAMRQALAGVARPDAADRVASLVEEHARVA